MLCNKCQCEKWKWQKKIDRVCEWRGEGVFASGGGAVFFPKEKNIFWVLDILCSFSIFQTLSFPEKMTSRRAFFHCFLDINKWIWQIIKFRKKILEFRKVWESRRQFWGQIMGKLANFALKSKKFCIFEFRFKIWLSLENLEFSSPWVWRKTVEKGLFKNHWNW